MLCHRSLLSSCGRIIPIAFEAIGQGIEVFSCSNALLRQHLEDLVAGVLIPIKHNREVGVVALYIFLNSTKFDTFHAGKALTVSLHDFLAFGDFLVQMPQVADTHAPM